MSHLMDYGPAVEWLERDYDDPDGFVNPSYGPEGLYQVKPDHYAWCDCDELLAWSPAAMKWVSR